MWKNKSGLRPNSSKKLVHFKSKCLKLEKSKDKYKHYKSKSLMSSWEDMDNTPFNEKVEGEANLCLMDDTTSEESESEQEKVDLDDPKSLRQTYHKLLSNSSIISKAYKKNLRNYPKIILN
ncbi:hypothetical protein GmHk_02G003764 [Glycine max]|nr:hypothetical protein GmHk_02G003764 [Glycine max]